MPYRDRPMPDDPIPTVYIELPVVVARRILYTTTVAESDIKAVRDAISPQILECPFAYSYLGCQLSKGHSGNHVVHNPNGVHGYLHIEWDNGPDGPKWHV